MLIFVPYSLFSSCCFLLITSVPCKYHQHSRTFVPLCLLQMMRDSKNIWISVNFSRQMNESQAISILSKLTAAMGYNYINRLCTEIHLNWSVTNVSIRRIKGNILSPHIRNTSVFLRGRKWCPSAPVPVWVFLHSSLQGGQDRRQDLGQGGTAMFAPSLKSPLSLNSAKLQPFIWRHPGPAWSFQTLLSAVLRWDTTSIPLLSLASVMFWQLTEEAGDGSKVRKDFGNFPSMSEIVLHSSTKPQLIGSQFTLGVWAKWGIH